MKTFCILHLSDLHISEADDPAKERLRDALRIDIKKLLKSNEVVVDCIAVTGDVTDRGGSAGSYAKARPFLDALLSELSLDSGKLAIVPGNHDIPRREVLTAFLEKSGDEDFLDRPKCIEHWDLLGKRFNTYLDFARNFGSTGEERGTIFGGGITDIIASSGTIRLFLLNTAWASCGKTDFSKQRIGRWQLEDLSKRSMDLPPADLCLALAHHPLDWLSATERDLLIEFLTRHLGVEALLHGHVHTGKIDVQMDPDKTLVRLVSGIGYPNADSRVAGQPKVSGCRYALYRFNVPAGSLEGWLRTSAENGSFAADTLLYKAAAENGYFNLQYKPAESLRTHSRAPVKLPAVVPIIELDPVPMIPDWVGREEELLRLRDRRIRAAAITGVGGQGKTAVASEFFRQHVHGKTPLFEAGVWADCRELPDSLHSKIIDVLCALSGGKETQDLFRDERIEDTARRLLRHFQKTETLIVLDNVDAYVKADSEGPTKELKPILDIVLNNEHRSMLLLTCRPPLTDSRGSFVHVLLPGLTEDEGVALFRKRNISITSADDESDCREIVRRTKGHPWWLGLIAGQIASKRESLRACVDRFRSGDFSASTAILDYFGGVWGQLKSKQRKLLRYLVESSRPLSENEIFKVTDIFSQKDLPTGLWRMRGLGLIERHQSTTRRGPAFQVHPLIREYVHQCFPANAQRHYVHSILGVFLPRQMVVLLFQPDTTAFKKARVSIAPDDLSDSIETCLNSRNDRQALSLLEEHKATLYDSGFQHRFLSLACRILDRLDWEQLELSNSASSAGVIATTIDQLELSGSKERAASYLDRYRSSVEPKSVSFLRYLSVAAHSFWQRDEHRKAIELCELHEALAAKLGSPTFGHTQVSHAKALAMRDEGKYEEALAFFQSDKDRLDRASGLGNSARCLFFLKRYREAEKSLRKSLLILKSERTYRDKVNLGYAYLWIAELRLAEGRNDVGSAFVTLARRTWAEYAPGLLYKVDEFCLRLSLGLNTVPDDQALKEEEAFLSLQPL